MTLVETNADETETDFRAAVGALLQAIAPDRRRWWLPYEVRGTYECRGIRFRHFYCIAGSVEAWIWSAANMSGSRRVILLSDESATVVGPVKMCGRGEEIVITPDQVQAVPPAV